MIQRRQKVSETRTSSSSSSNSNNNNSNSYRLSWMVAIISLVALLSFSLYHIPLATSLVTDKSNIENYPAPIHVPVDKNVKQNTNISSFIPPNTPALTEDIDVILKEIYKYVPPFADAVPQHQQQQEDKINIEEYCGSSPDFSKFFSMPAVQSRSANKEDISIYETFFKNKNNIKGTYIELGAFDGLREANTLFFDKCLKWKGLLLEGNPSTYGQLVSNRPNAHRMNFAPSCVQWNDTVTFYNIPLTNAGIAGHAISYEHADGTSATSKVDIPCGPLGPVIEKLFPAQLQLQQKLQLRQEQQKQLLQNLPARVSFFSLDVEGAEKLVLDTIDFTKVQIDVFMIEVVNSHCPMHKYCKVRNQVRNKMINELGYEQRTDIVHKSDVYIHPNFKYNSPLKSK